MKKAELNRQNFYLNHQIAISRQRGISIVEMAVVIVIISIIMGFGLQNWGIYTRRAKSVEAKSNLLRVYAAQERYKQTCGTYYPDLRVIGAIPEGLVRYNIGSATLQVSDADDECLTSGVTCQQGSSTMCHTSSVAGCCALRIETLCAQGENTFKNDSTYSCYWPLNIHFVRGSDFTNFVNTNKAKLYPSGATDTRVGVHHKGSNPMYIIHAIGDIRSSRNSSRYDAWTINHKGIVQHLQNGID